MNGLQSLSSQHEGRPRHWLLVVSLMLIYSYAFVDRIALALLVDPIKRDLRATDLQMSLMLGLAFALFYGLFSIPSGHLVDRYDRRRLIAFASIGWALMTIVCGTATTVAQLFVGRAGVGLMEAVVTPAAFSLIRDAVPVRSRGLAFSTYALAPVLGGGAALAGSGLLLRLAVGGAFSGIPLLGRLSPWQDTLVIVGLSGLPLSLLLLTFREPQRVNRAVGRGDGMLKGLAAVCRFMGRNRGLYAPLLVFAAVGAMMSFSYNAWLPAAVARRYVLLPQRVGPVLGGIALVSGAAGLFFGGVMMNGLARRGRSVMSYGIVAVIATAVGIGGACVAHSALMAFVSAAFGIFFLGISNPAGATELSEATPPEMIGKVSAVYLLVQTLIGQTMGPLGVAVVGARFFAGRSSIAFGLVVVQISCAFVAVICGLLILRCVRSSSTTGSR